MGREHLEPYPLPKIPLVTIAQHLQLFYLDRDVVIEGDVVLGLNGRATHESEDRKDKKQSCS